MSDSCKTNDATIIFKSKQCFTAFCLMVCCFTFLLLTHFYGYLFHNVFFLLQKSSFSKFDALQKKNVLHVRSSDSSKAQEKFSVSFLTLNLILHTEYIIEQPKTKLQYIFCIFTNNFFRVLMQKMPTARHVLSKCSRWNKSKPWERYGIETALDAAIVTNS